MSKRALVRWLAVGVLAALTMAGCTAGREDQPEHTDDPRTSPPTGEQLADRDRTAVLAALRGLDTCELLLTASAGLVTPPAGTEPRLVFPANCLLGTDPSGVASIGIEVYDTWPQPIDYGAERRRELGGAAAFVDGSRPTTCVVDLPVSPTTALEVQADDLNATTSPCDLAESVAAATATTLDDPDRVRAAPRWGPCDALRTARGENSDGSESESFASAACTDETSGATLSFRAGEPGVAGTEAAGGTPWRAEPVSGADVWFSDNPTNGICYAEWAAGQLGSPYSIASDVLLAEVSAKSCADAKALVEPLVGVLEQPPPDVAPQRPVLYPA